MFLSDYFLFIVAIIDIMFCAESAKKHALRKGGQRKQIAVWQKNVAEKSQTKQKTFRRNSVRSEGFFYYFYIMLFSMWTGRR